MLPLRRLLHSACRSTKIYRMTSRNLFRHPFIDSGLANPEDQTLLVEVDEKHFVINENFLKNIGKRENGKMNLIKTSFQDPPFPITGKFYGHSAFMVCMACQLARHPNAPVINVWFTVNTGLHWTYLSEKTFKALCAPKKSIDWGQIHLQDPNCIVECYYDDKFKEVNVLGSQAMEDLKISNINFDWKKMSFVLSRN